MHDGSARRHGQKEHSGDHQQQNGPWTSWFSSSLGKANGFAGLSNGNGSHGHDRKKHASTGSSLSVASEGTSGSSVLIAGAGTSLDEQHNHHLDEFDGDVHAYEEALIEDAQLALISHNYKSAVRRFRRAVRAGSPAAALSLGNIFVKGITCKEHEKQEAITSDPIIAARYYIAALELWTERADTDHMAGEVEIVQDAATGLCSLYRLGRIRPERDSLGLGSSPTNTSAMTSNGHAERHENVSLWQHGGIAAQMVVHPLEDMLGLASPEESELPTTDPGDDGGEAQNGISDFSENLDDDIPKKSVSFSRLPPSHRSTLDPISSRQARAALVHLYYVIALVQFSDPTAKATARDYWDKIVALGQQKGTFGSKEADELVQKARTRLDMLSSKRPEAPTSIAIPDTDLTVHDMMSPPSSASNEHHKFNFTPLHDTRGSKRRPHFSINRSKRKSDNRSASGHSASSTLSSTSQPQSIPSPPVLVEAEVLPLAPPPKEPSRTVSGTSSTATRKAKFSLSDSPASVRTYSGSNIPRSDSNDSILPRAAQSGPRSPQGVPWPVGTASSSTGVSLKVPEFGGAEQRPRTVKRQPSRLLGIGHPPRPSLLGPNWATPMSKASTQTSDPGQVALDATDMRQNSTSVASLPHVSTNGKSGRSFSSANLFFNPSQKFRDSSASLATLGKGIQKSFSSLRNLFVPSSHAADATDYSSITEHEETEEDQREREFVKLQARLREQARLHDETVAEYRFWDQVYADRDDSESLASSVRESFERSGEVGHIESGSMKTKDFANGGPSTPPEQSPPIPVPVTNAEPRSTFKSESLSGSAGKLRLPLRHSLPSSKVNAPHTPTQGAKAPPSTPSTEPAKRSGGGRKQKRRSGLPALSAPGTPGIGQQSGAATPTPHELDENGEIRGPLKIDPLLQALEDASRVNVKSRCAVCNKSGFNFPKCHKCKMTFCSRDCRMAAGENGRHVCT